MILTDLKTRLACNEYDNIVSSPPISGLDGGFNRA